MCRLSVPNPHPPDLTDDILIFGSRVENNPSVLGCDDIFYQPPEYAGSDIHRHGIDSDRASCQVFKTLITIDRVMIRVDWKHIMAMICQCHISLVCKSIPIVGRIEYRGKGTEAMPVS